MIIPVVSAVGRGPTDLAAFDAALVAAGVADRNLIYLSSVLPPDTTVKVVDHVDAPGRWGDRLYCVMAKATTAIPGAETWAGIGWVRNHDGDGLLVEHHADDEPTLRNLIDESLAGLCYNRRVSYPYRGMEIRGATCLAADEPACAMVVAVFEAVPWGMDIRPGSDA